MLIKQEEIDKLDKQGEMEDLEYKPIAMKFFLPTTNWRWYVLEAKKEKDDVIFFGLVEGNYREYGYFSLSELENLTTSMGMVVERDIYFDNKYVNQDNEIVHMISCIPGPGVFLKDGEALF